MLRILFLVVLCVIAVSVSAQREDEPPHKQEIAANQDWQPVVRVYAGQYIEIEQTRGSWRNSPTSPGINGDGGSSHVCGDPHCVEILPDYPQAMLIGQIGTAFPFPVGNYTHFQATHGGVLSLRINDAGLDDNDGTLTVTVTVRDELPTSEENRVDVDATHEWQSAGIVIQAGDTLYFEQVEGEWRTAPTSDFFGIEGGSSSVCEGSSCDEMLAGVPQGGLVARINSGEVFSADGSSPYIARDDGLLLLRINDLVLFDNEGTVTVQVRVIPAQN